MKKDQLSNSSTEKKPVAYTNIYHSGTSYVQNTIENVAAENAMNEEAAENLVKQVMQNKDSDIEKQ